MAVSAESQGHEGSSWGGCMSVCPLLTNQFTPAAAGPSPFPGGLGWCVLRAPVLLHGRLPTLACRTRCFAFPPFQNQPLFPLRSGRGGTAPCSTQPSSAFTFVALEVLSPDGCPVSVDLFVNSITSHCGEPGGAGGHEPGSRWWNNSKHGEMSGGGPCRALPSDQNQLLRQQSCQNKPLGAPLAWGGSSCLEWLLFPGEGRVENPSCLVNPVLARAVRRGWCRGFCSGQMRQVSSRESLRPGLLLGTSRGCHRGGGV